MLLLLLQGELLLNLLVKRLLLLLLNLLRLHLRLDLLLVYRLLLWLHDTLAVDGWLWHAHVCALALHGDLLGVLDHLWILHQNRIRIRLLHRTGFYAEQLISRVESSRDTTLSSVYSAVCHSSDESIACCVENSLCLAVGEGHASIQ